LVKVSQQIFCLARKSAQNEVVGHLNNAAALMQQKPFHVYIDDEIFILSIFSRQSEK